MKIHSYRELQDDLSLLLLVKNADSSNRQIAAGPHWVEVVLARYLLRKRRGVCFFLYIRCLSDGELYRIAITMAHYQRQYDRLLRQHPDGSIYRIGMELKKSGNVALDDLTYLYTPMNSVGADRIPLQLVYDWCQPSSAGWFRVPLIRKVFSETGYELLILCTRPKLMVDTVDIANKALGIGSSYDLVEALLDWDRYANIIEQLPPDRSFTEPLIPMHSILAMVHSTSAPRADDAILSGVAIGYSSKRFGPNNFNVTYAFLDSIPSLRGEKANRNTIGAADVISKRILLTLITVLQPKLILTLGHDVARQVPKIFEPLLVDEAPVRMPPFRRVRKNRLWGLHEAVGQEVSESTLFKQSLKMRDEPAFFMPILNAAYWGKENIYNAPVPDGYWASIVRFFQGRVYRSRPINPDVLRQF